MTQALARTAAFSGLSARALTVIRTVSSGWLTVIWLSSTPAESLDPVFLTTRSAVFVLVAIATYDVALDFARLSPIEASAVLLVLPSDTNPVAVAW